MGLQTSPLSRQGIDLGLSQKISMKLRFYPLAVSLSLTAILAAMVIIRVWSFYAAFKALPLLLASIELIAMVVGGLLSLIADLGFEL